MRKEVLFAVVFGITFGLIVAFGVWRLNTNLSSGTGKDDDGSTTQTDESPAPSGEHALTIAKPNDYSIIKEESVSITGATKSDSWIIISNVDEDFVEQAKQDGAFEVSTDLQPGLNSLEIVAVAGDDRREKTLPLVYSSSFFESDENDNKSAVEKRIEDAQNPPIAYVGNITDIFENTIHVRNGGEEIKQVSVSDSTTYTNDITDKESSFEELAIGDHVIAMGFVNGNKVLETRRIVVSDAPTPLKRTIRFATVESVTKKELVLDQGGQTVELEFPKSWKGPDPDEIENNDELIVVTNADDSIRTIHILPRQ